MKNDDFFEELLKKVAWELVHAKTNEEIEKILSRPGLQKYLPQIRQYAQEFRQILDSNANKNLSPEVKEIRHMIEDLQKKRRMSAAAGWFINILSLILSLASLAYLIYTTKKEFLRLKEYIVEIISRIK